MPHSLYVKMASEIKKTVDELVLPIPPSSAANSPLPS